MKLSEWYNINEPVIKFGDVIIRCVRPNSISVKDELFKCLLQWKDAINLFGEYTLQEIRQGHHVSENARHETYHTIQCTIYPDWDKEEQNV